MKQEIKLGLLIVFVISALSLIWINTGSRTIPGYTYCGGGGFIPGNQYTALCLGQPTTGKVSGRYSNPATANEIAGLLATLSFIAFIILRIKKPSKKR